MAEVVAGVASGVGLAAFAGQILDGALKVQRTWHAVKDARKMLPISWTKSS